MRLQFATRCAPCDGCQFEFQGRIPTFPETIRPWGGKVRHWRKICRGGSLTLHAVLVHYLLLGPMGQKYESPALLGLSLNGL